MRAEHVRRARAPGPRATLATLLALAALLAGCATRHAPREWLPYAEQVQREAYGGWIRLELGEGASAAIVGGELLAVSPDTIYTLRDSTVRATSTAAVTRAVVEYYDPRSKELAQMTLAGTLLTFSHGWWLVLTAPLWVIVGSASTGALSHDGQVTLKSAQQARARSGSNVVTWKDLALHARFPQGMPPALDRTALHERPPREKPAKRPPFPGTITTR